MKKIVPILIIIAIAVDVGVIVMSHSRQQKVGGLEKISIRLEWVHQAQFAGFYVADKKGFYQARGIEVTINPGGVDFPAVQMVASGSDDFGLEEGDRILEAREKGVPIVAIATIYRKNPTLFFSLKNSGITKAKDFIGKKVGTFPDVQVLLSKMLERAGVSENRVEIVPVKYDITPLLTGEIDVWPGYAINEPILAEEQGYEVNRIWPSDYGINSYSMTLFTSEKLIREKPDVVRNFVEATIEGWSYAYEHPDSAVEITLGYSDQLNKEHETKMMHASLELLKPDGKQIGYMDKRVWEEMQSIFLDKPINIDTVFTNEFLPK